MWIELDGKLFNLDQIRFIEPSVFGGSLLYFSKNGFVKVGVPYEEIHQQIKHSQEVKCK